MILLDTHTLIWLRLGSQKLGPKARQVIDKHCLLGQAHISAISFWEMAMLEQKGRLELTQNIEDWRKGVLRQGLGEIPVSGQMGIRAANLSDLPGDPADRIIVATALDGYQLITADQDILKWPGTLRRLNARI